MLQFVLPVLMALFLASGCTTSQNDASSQKPKPVKAAKPVKRAEPARPAETLAAKPKSGSKDVKSSNPLMPQKVSSSYNSELQSILNLADAGKWEQAEAEANALAAKAPDDPSVYRVQSWVQKQRQQQRDKALEDRIRSIDAKHSPTDPSLPDVLLDSKNRGLPPQRGLRDAVQQMKNAPYVPESYGKTNYQKGVLFDVETAQGRMAKVLDKQISVHLDNVTLEAIIFNIGQAEGINFVADKALPAFKQTLSVNMDKVKLSEFLNYVSRNLDVQFQVGDDLIWIVDGKDPKRIYEETRFYKLRKGFILQAQHGPTEVQRTITQVPNVTTTTEVQKLERFVNDGAPAQPSIVSAITNFFKGSKYMIDYERNLIIATGTPEQLQILDKLVEEFDKPLQQVLIEARFITVTEAAFLQLGMNWETDHRGVERSSKDLTGLLPSGPTGLPDNLGMGLGFQKTFTHNTNSILSREGITATLTALEQSGESRTLSAPRLTLINNLPARISDGKVQYYYEEYQVKQTILERRSTSTLVPSGKPVKITAGVSLDVLASIGGDGKSICLALNPEVNQDVVLKPFATVSDRDENGKLVSSFDINLPESRTQSLQTRVVVKSGETVAMGGVMERDQRTIVESVPILGRIPIIGAAFRKRTEIDKPRYLLIFVTATLLSDTGEFLVYDEPEKKK